MRRLYKGPGHAFRPRRIACAPQRTFDDLDGVSRFRSARFAGEAFSQRWQRGRLKKPTLPQLPPSLQDRLAIDFLPEGDVERGPHEDLEVKSKRGVTNVPEVQRGFIRCGDLATAFDLSPASQPRTDQQPGSQNSGR